ncbi:MAG: hypothetical protein EPN20_06740, partial [Magnetospirillum sp.]
MTWPFAALRPLSYGAILADPPWAFRLRSEAGEEKSPQAHYGCMDLDAIKALPVSHLAAPDCLLVMWATAPIQSGAVTTRQGLEDAINALSSGDELLVWRFDRMSRDLIVRAPTPVLHDLVIQIAPNTAEVRTAAEAAVRAWYRAESVPGQLGALSRLSAAISAADGETKHRIVSPSADVVL